MLSAGFEKPVDSIIGTQGTARAPAAAHALPASGHQPTSPCSTLTALSPSTTCGLPSGCGNSRTLSHLPPSIQPNPTPQDGLLCRGRREHRRPQCSCSCPACRLASALLRGPAAPSAQRAWRLQSTRRQAASVAEKPKFWAEERARKLQVGSVLGWNAVVEDQGAVGAEDKAAEGLVS